MTDVDTIMAWRRERESWLATRHEDQWSVPLPRSAVVATVAANQTWLVSRHGQPMATITLTGWPAVDGLWKPDVDPDPLWYPADDPADALYVSKMMVPLNVAGHGIGSEMLEWAAGRAHDAGLAWLRLDAWTTNPRLHRYYGAQGFRHVRTVTSRVSGACFQRRAMPYRGHLKI